MDQRIAHIAVAVVRNGDTIIMVQQQGVNDPYPYWTLPGGLVEPGELLTEALIREVHEESGIRIEEIAHLAYCCQIDHPQRAAQTVAFAFEIRTWAGTPRTYDPDGEVLQVAWVPLAAAIERLQRIGWRGMREPMQAYLRGDCAPGTVWLYREAMEEQVCLACLPAPQSHT